MSTVLLGVPDVAVETNTTWEVNKIGGKPDLMLELPAPVCERCGSIMVHVMQIYCPLELSPFHRVLHIFACTTKSCWNKPTGWKVYRSQLRDNNSLSVDANSVDTEKVTMETSDWCDEADDWGCDDGAEDLVAMVTGNQTDTKIETDISNGQVFSMEAESSCSESVESSDSCVVSRLDELDVSEESSDVAEEDGCLHPEKASIENALSYLATSDSQSKDCNAAESLPASETCLQNFKCFYLDVFDEPANDMTDVRHVTKLLKEYERRERVDVSSLVDCDRSGGKAGAGEKYEKTELKHGDKYFHKFMKRLKICPEQVVRYHYGGSPLPISQLKEDLSPPVCPVCRTPRVFELQLVPPLIPYLRNSQETGPAVEFGTVLVFTCGRSCWEEESPLPREEYVVVQPDPDQDLFKV